MEAFHQINGFACFIVGTGLNALLVWMIKYQSSDELRPYSRILLQVAYMDLLTLTTAFFVEGVSRYSNKYKLNS